MAPNDGQDVREHLIERFARWLDDVLAREEPPEGLAAEVLAEIEGTVDLDRVASLEGRFDTQALWSALTSLSQEVKLQGRAFKDLSEQSSSLVELGPRIDTVRGNQARILEAIEHFASESRDVRAKSAHELIAEGERRGQRDMLDLVLDLRDRLLRGRAVISQRETCDEAAPSPRRGWLARIFRRKDLNGAGSSDEAVAAMRTGYALTLERIRESIERLGLEEIACEGRPFDPHRMEAVDLTRTSDVAEGTILEVLRAGYLWRGELIRPARVRVAVTPLPEAPLPEAAPPKAAPPKAAPTGS